MRVVDTHFHLWDVAQNRYPWLTEPDRPTLVRNASDLPRKYLPADFLRDVGSLDLVAAVHVQAEHDRSDPVRETRWLQQLADAPGTRGVPQAIVAEADFARGQARSILEGHCAFPNMRGIRFALHRRLDEQPPHDPLLDPAWVRNFALLREFDLSFDMQLFPRQHAAAVALCRAHPDIQVVLTHTGMPLDTSVEGTSAWRRAIDAFARCPNVAIKISGFAAQGGSWNARTIAPWLQFVVDAFSTARVMLASNFPVEGLLMRYQDIWRAFDESFASFSDGEREQVFWRNAVRIYRIHLLTTHTN